MLDFRSDTVTQPTAAMRAAMAAAEVGDDVYGDDPTVNLLEAEAARAVGKESALFVCSGTMGNQLAIMAQTARGDEIIVDYNAHIAVHEVGAAAVLSGVSLRTPVSRRGVMDGDDVRRAIRGEDIHAPRTALLCLENAHGGGQALGLPYMAAMRSIADEARIPIHLDGARLFNAALALGCEARELAGFADTVMFCLSKGLCAPVGSMLCGPREVIERARKMRKLLGGGMRQTGVLAAAGRIALSDMRERLKDDHRTAARLAARLAAIEGAELEGEPDINMVFVRFPGKDTQTLHEVLLASGILVNAAEDGALRLVTHHQITMEDVDAVADALADWAARAVS